VGGSHDNSWKQELAARFQMQASGEADDLGECASRPMPSGWPGVYIHNGSEDIRAFQYVHMGLEWFAADGRSFVIEFTEVRP
jgi:hypothetical protein